MLGDVRRRRSVAAARVYAHLRAEPRRKTAAAEEPARGQEPVRAHAPADIHSEDETVPPTMRSGEVGRHTVV